MTDPEPISDEEHHELIRLAIEEEQQRPPVAHPPAHLHPRIKQWVYGLQLAGESQDRARTVFARRYPQANKRGLAYGFIDLLSDEDDGPEPMVGCRSDGQQLFYRSAYNILWGPPQARKSWVAILAIKQVVVNWLWPQRCVYFDYEDSARHFKERLRLIGCGPHDEFPGFTHRQGEDDSNRRRLAAAR